jgi:transposase-like protein
VKAVEVFVENTIIQIKLSPKEHSTTMKNDTKKPASNVLPMPLGLEEMIRNGARQIISQALEAEITELLGQYSNVLTLDGKPAVVRNGYLPERPILTAVGPVPVKVPRVRDRNKLGVRFNSNLIPAYIRKSTRMTAAIPWLYLKGISTGDMSEALCALLGDDAKGLSANVVARLKAVWVTEYQTWSTRDLSAAQYIYWWADGIHTGVRAEDSNGQCLLVIIGVRPDGTKERVAIGEGFAETKEAWTDVLLDLKKRGLATGPLLATGDGALGFWAAMQEVYPEATTQRCWVHKTKNVLNALPKSLHAKAKEDLRAIWMASNLKAAQQALNHFVQCYQGKYPKAADKVIKDQDPLLAFYDFPAEHWQHIRTTNPIESTFATVRHRTTRTRNCVSRNTFLGLAYKLIEEAEKSWRTIRGANQIELLLSGTIFKDGEPISKSTTEQQKHAA